MAERKEVTRKKHILSALGIAANVFLFIIKITVGLLSGSIALLSDAFNSLTDIIASTFIFFAVRISSKEADHGYPFGYHRIEPLAGFVVSIFTGILGFEIIRAVIANLFNHQKVVMALPAIIVLAVTIVVKSIMAHFFTLEGRKINSPALKATGVDARNDILVSSVALFGVVGTMYGLKFLDEIAALIISCFIFYSGYKLAVENVNYLIGKAPPQEDIDKIVGVVRGIKGVIDINDVRAHYVGNYIHIEIHIEVDKNLSTEKSHAIGKNVQYAVDSLPYVDKTFVHIDPVKKISKSQK
jgi:cation diffusion facilitator family transporter